MQPDRPYDYYGPRLRHSMIHDSLHGGLYAFYIPFFIRELSMEEPTCCSDNNLDNIPILNWMIAPHLLTIKARGWSPDTSIATASSKILMDLSSNIDDSSIRL